MPPVQVARWFTINPLDDTPGSFDAATIRRPSEFRLQDGRLSQAAPVDPLATHHLSPGTAPARIQKTKGTTGKSCPIRYQDSRDSERKLQSHLPDAGITGVSNLAEVATVDVATRIGELSVIVDIEKFCTKFHRHPFADPSVLV
jgi:hypothetical protein